MESWFRRSRLLVYTLPLVLITIMSTAAGAQGLFGIGFPGASYLNGVWRGSVVGWGAPGRPGTGPTIYVGGSADYAGGTGFGFSTLGLALFGVTDAQYSYPNRGVWLGFMLPIDLGPRLVLYASEWSFLRAGNVHSLEIYDSGFASREWQVTPDWTIWEGLALLRLGYGFNILGGFRYDHYDASFKNPANPVSVTSLPTDQADLDFRSYIPLIGAQYEHDSYLGSLLFRAVGFPALGGDVKYLEPFIGVGAFQATGSYRRGYFFELFMEYTKKFGPSQVGLFGRWNELHALSTASVNQLQGGAVQLTQNYDFSFNRTSWTLGGSVSLAFNLPY